MACANEGDRCRVSGIGGLSATRPTVPVTGSLLPILPQRISSPIARLGFRIVVEFFEVVVEVFGLLNQRLFLVECHSTARGMPFIAIGTVVVLSGSHARIRCNGCTCYSPSSSAACAKLPTTAGRIFQISRAYSAIVRSDENFPTRAMLNSDLRSHVLRSR
jgi:hypothetical protein